MEEQNEDKSFLNKLYSKISNKSDDEEQFKKNLFYIFRIAVILLGSIFVFEIGSIFLIKSGSIIEDFFRIDTTDRVLTMGIKDTVEILGPFGDFFGGMLNPILTFCSFMALLITISIQSKELKNSTEELAKSSEALTEQSKSLKIQNFENTFFNMINLHNEGIKYILLKESVHIHQMRGKKLPNGYGIDSIDKKTVDYYSINGETINLGADRDYIGKEAISRLFLILLEYQEKKGWENYKSNYFNFYEEYRNLLTQYFKLIYQILLLIQNNGGEEELQLKYANIFKAQFTIDELNIIIFHLITNNDTLGEYIKFVEKYSFFDSVSYNEYLFKIPIESLDNCSFGTNHLIISKLNEKRISNTSSQEQQ